MHLTFVLNAAVKKLQVEEIENGFRFREGRDDALTAGTVFGFSFGLVWVALGIGMLFLPETAMPGASPLLKAVIGAVLAGFGAFILGAVRNNRENVLEADLAHRTLRHFIVDRHNRRGGYREIAFSDVMGVFTEANQGSDEQRFPQQSLIINLRSRPGRLSVLTSNDADIASLRDFLATEVLNGQAAPVVNGLRSLVERTGWEIRQRSG